MTKLDLDADNVFIAEMSVDNARECLGIFEIVNVDGALDEAQAFVYDGSGNEAFLIIKIVEDEETENEPVADAAS